MDPSFLANVCAGFSLVGMAFLVFVAIVMETQSLFLRGVSVRSSSTGAYDDGSDHHPNDGLRRETSNALKAAAAYFLLMVVSLVYLQAKDANLELTCPAVFGRACHARRLISSAYFRYRRRHYDDIPDGDDRRPGGTYDDDDDDGPSMSWY